MINHKGTRIVKDGKIDTDFKTRQLKKWAKLFKPLNRDIAPLTGELKALHKVVRNKSVFN